MKFTSKKVWIPVKDEMESESYMKRKIIPFLIIFFVVSVALVIVAWYEAYLIDISGYTVADFSLGIWIFVILVGAVVITILIVMHKFRGCGDYKEEAVLFSVFATTGALLVLHGIGHGIWFAMQISGTSGYPYTILVLETIFQFLIAVMGIMVVIGMSAIIRSGKRKCETILYGTNLSPQFFNGEDVNAKIRCKKKGSTIMCKVPRISSLE